MARRVYSLRPLETMSVPYSELDSEIVFAMAEKGDPIAKQAID